MPAFGRCRTLLSCEVSYFRTKMVFFITWLSFFVQKTCLDILSHLKSIKNWHKVLSNLISESETWCHELTAIKLAMQTVTPPLDSFLPTVGDYITGPLTHVEPWVEIFNKKFWEAKNSSYIHFYLSFHKFAKNWLSIPMVSIKNSNWILVQKTPFYLKGEILAQKKFLYKKFL